MFNGSDDPDVKNDGGDPSTTTGVFVPVSSTGQATSLPAVGATWSGKKSGKISGWRPMNDLGVIRKILEINQKNRK
jgi:hypothetical protein